jgi:hypothetical protein
MADTAVRAAGPLPAAPAPRPPLARRGTKHTIGVVDPAVELAWFRVYTKNRGFNGKRYGIEFHHGEGIVSNRHVWEVRQGNTTDPRRELVVDLFRIAHKDYTVTPIPADVLPVPTWQLAHMEEAP